MENEAYIGTSILTGDYRFVTIYYGGYMSKMSFTFLLHEPSCLVAGMYGRDYAISEGGKLIIWEKPEYGGSFKPAEVKGLVFEANDPLVVLLKKCLLEESEFRMLGGADDQKG